VSSCFRSHTSAAMAEWPRKIGEPSRVWRIYQPLRESQASGTWT
jgi:hypothetical protein